MAYLFFTRFAYCVGIFSQYTYCARFAYCDNIFRVKKILFSCLLDFRINRKIIWKIMDDGG